MKYRIFILTQLSILAVSTFLVISLGSCAPNVDAAIQAEWIHIEGTEAMESVNILETDELRPYAGTINGVFVSINDGDTWCSTGFEHPVRVTLASSESTYVGSNVYDGVFQSDDRGKT